MAKAMQSQTFSTENKILIRLIALSPYNHIASLAILASLAICWMPACPDCLRQIWGEAEAEAEAEEAGTLAE